MDTVLSILVLAALALAAGGIWLLRRGGAQRNAWLMLLLAAIMIGNVLIWTVPTTDGTALLDRAAEGPK